MEINIRQITHLTHRFKKTSMLLAIAVIAALGYTLFFLAPADPPPPDVKIVEVITAQTKDIQQTAQFIGTIKAEKGTLLIAKSRGILDRYATSGQQLKAGELIAKIENNDVERNYKLSQDMEKIAQVQYERFKQLLDSGVLSKNAVEEKKSLWMEFQKKLSDAKIALDDINIYAPFDGVVGVFKVREGSQVQNGDVLVNFYDPSTTIVEFDVPLSVARLVHDGSPVFIDNQPYALTHIQKMLDEDTHMSPAYTDIDCNNCIIGSTVNVELVVQQKSAVIVIPYEAIFLRDGKPHVYLAKDDQAVLTPVELGIRAKEVTEITAGLKNGDQVIVRGQARLYPGVSIKIATQSGNAS
ncbi:MAG: mdtA 2 [Gammaproteobacteria bacterium]|nr:mdtA 2 [Gammaproteobacteria bacterium]